MPTSAVCSGALPSPLPLLQLPLLPVCKCLYGTSVSLTRPQGTEAVVAVAVAKAKLQNTQQKLAFLVILRR